MEFPHLRFSTLTTEFGTVRVLSRRISAYHVAHLGASVFDANSAAFARWQHDALQLVHRVRRQNDIVLRREKAQNYNHFPVRNRNRNYRRKCRQ